MLIWAELRQEEMIKKRFAKEKERKTGSNYQTTGNAWLMKKCQGIHKKGEKS